MSGLVASVLAAWILCFALFAAFLVWGNIPPRQVRSLVIESQRDEVNLFLVGAPLSLVGKHSPSTRDKLPGLLLVLMLTSFTLWKSSPLYLTCLQANQDRKVLFLSCLPQLPGTHCALYSFPFVEKEAL